MKLAIQKGNKLIVRIPRTGKISLLPGSDVTVDEAMKKWIQGFMAGVKRHPVMYKRKGVSQIIFTYGKKKMIRKL